MSYSKDVSLGNFEPKWGFFEKNMQARNIVRFILRRLKFETSSNDYYDHPQD